MILHEKKTLVSKQYEYWFFKVLRLCYKQGLKISRLVVDCDRLTRLLVNTQW